MHGRKMSEISAQLDMDHIRAQTTLSSPKNLMSIIRPNAVARISFLGDPNHVKLWKYYHFISAAAAAIRNWRYRPVPRRPLPLLHPPSPTQLGPFPRLAQASKSQLPH